MSQLNTQKLYDVTNKVTHRIYNKTYNIVVLILYLKLTKNVAALAVFNTI